MHARERETSPSESVSVGCPGSQKKSDSFEGKKKRRTVSSDPQGSPDTLLSADPSASPGQCDRDLIV